EGEVLAILESKEMAEAQSNYLAALKKLRLKQNILQREEGLRQISPEQDYLQAQFAVEESKIDIELSKQKLHALGLDDREIAQISESNGRFYEMRAPFEGEVIQRDLTFGELIDDQHKAYTIADFSRVRAEFSVNPSNFPYIKQGQAIEISAADGTKVKTTIFHVEPMISEQTRNAIVLANIDNRSGQWIPGKFVTAIIERERESVPIIVPKDAIQKIKGQDSIFIFDQDTFTPRVVKTGRADEKNIEITSGLQKGERYVANHAFLLKADLEKAEAEHSHTH
ncbi:MAG: efflux RND transporter periplasmic adaptor subunit, partial [Parachlamydia sp.]|nr:efflux RND transporter periplasmic adaptor subunit [Parachlamydia sp.]